MLHWRRSDRRLLSAGDRKESSHPDLICLHFFCCLSSLFPTGAESLNRNSFSFSDERLNSPTVLSPTTISPPLTSPKREFFIFICFGILLIYTHQIDMTLVQSISMFSIANITTLQQSPVHAYYCFVFDVTLNRNVTKDRGEGLILYKIHFANVF